jgi:hypothetical protein
MSFMRFSPARLRWKYLNRDHGFAGGLALAVFGTVLAIGGGLVLTTELRYLTGGVLAEARVLAKWQAAGERPAAVAAVLAHGGGRRGPRYTVSYEFTDTAGQVHAGSATIGKADWDQLGPGDALDVEYLAAEPGTSRPLDPLRPVLGLGFALETLGCPMLLGGLTLLRRRWAAVTDQVRLIGTGQPVLGLIDEVRALGKKGEPCVTVRYRYVSPGGESAPQVRGGTSAPVPADARRWRAGGPILVLVDPDEPDRHAADLFSARPEDLERLCPPGAAM